MENSFVSVNDLKIIPNPKGDIYRALRSEDISFKAFGEAYFSCIHHEITKGWKKHTKMTMNLIVPVGDIRLFFYSQVSSSCQTIDIGESNYKRVTVPPGIWMAFQGLSKDLNLMLNIADLIHDPDEAINVDISTFSTKNAFKL